MKAYKCDVCHAYYDDPLREAFAFPSSYGDGTTKTTCCEIAYKTSNGEYSYEVCPQCAKEFSDFLMHRAQRRLSKEKGTKHEYNDINTKEK